MQYFSNLNAFRVLRLPQQWLMEYQVNEWVLSEKVCKSHYWWLDTRKWDSKQMSNSHARCMTVDSLAGQTLLRTGHYHFHCKHPHGKVLQSGLFFMNLVGIKAHGSATVVSRKAKKQQSESQKTKRATNYCVSFTRANVFVIWRHNHSQYLSTRIMQLLNPHCRHTIFFPTLTNTPKIKAISEVVCHSQHCPSRWFWCLLIFFSTEVASSPFSMVIFL